MRKKKAPRTLPILLGGMVKKLYEITVSKGDICKQAK